MAADKSANGDVTRRSVIQLTGAAFALPVAQSKSNHVENWRMSFTPKFVDLVRNYTTTVGTGNFVLGPSVTGYTSFATAVQPGESFYYSVLGFDRPNEREIGRGTMQADRTIKREPIGGALTNFTNGTKTIALIAAAEWFETIQAGGSARAAATRTEMAAIAPAESGATCHLREHGREGLFVHFTAVEFADRYGFPLADAVAADTLQGMYVATGTGAWVREGDRITPLMFGGRTNYKTGHRTKMVPPYGESATPGSTDGVLIDSRAACQAVLDMVAFHKNRDLVADFSGGLWGIAKRGDGGPHDQDGLVIDQPQEYARRFIGGEFRGIGAGRHLIYVDEGSCSKFEGNWHIRSGADGGSSYGYPIRQWETGIWLRNSAQCRWDLVKVSGFKRWGIEFDPEFNATDYNNNIGARFERVYGNNNGSACDREGFNLAIDFSASARVGGPGGISQRTNLTLGAGHEVLRVDDIIRDQAGHYHVIMEKAGNVISVFPWIISTAATGTITSCHGGAMRVRGKDVAGAGADLLSAVLNGATLDIGNSLHGTEWGNVIQEGGGLGTLIGTVNGANLGHTIAHMHSEGNSLDLLSVGLVNTELLIGACSAWAAQDYNDPFKLTEVLAPNDGVAVSTGYGLPQVGIFIGGQWVTSGATPGGSSVATKSRAFAPVLSNSPVGNRIRKVQAAGTPTNATLKYYERTDRFRRDSFAAELEIVGVGGNAPSDAITVTLDPADAASGIQFANGTTATTYVVPAGSATGPVSLEFWLDTNGSTLRWIVVTKSGRAKESILIAASDETTALTAGSAKATFRMPYAFRLIEVRAALTFAQVSGATFTVGVNEDANPILSSKLTIDNGERTSTTASAPPVIAEPLLADDAEISIDIDQVGDGTAMGLKVMLIGYRP